MISGFLITQILLADIREQRFSLAKFYGRRIRRIFPAFLVVCAFSIGFAALIFTPQDFQQLGRSVVWAGLFSSNVLFWQESGYFDTAAHQKPLLHTWSLSVEEQFYLFFPLSLLAIHKWFKDSLVPAVLAVAMASFGASIWFVYSKPTAAFFLIPTRAWELLVGTLIALVPKGTGQGYESVSSWVAIVLLVAPVVLYSASTPFPGAAALLPVLGTAILIGGAGERSAVIYKVLGSDIIVTLGLISYSLYLWHFPLFAFLNYVTISQPTLTARLLVCAVSIAIAYLSWRFIEMPFRKVPPLKWQLKFLILSGIASVVCGAIAVAGHGWPSRLDTIALSYTSAQEDRDRHPRRCLSVEDQIVDPSNACRLGSADAAPSAILWGDSHSMVTATAMEQSAYKNASSFLYAGSVDCPIGIGFEIDAETGPAFVRTPGYRFCGQYNLRMLELTIRRADIPKVILSARWTNWRLGEPGSDAEKPVDIRLRDSNGTAASFAANKEVFASGFERLVRALLDAGKEIWIVGPVPEPRVDVPRSLYVKRLGFDTTDIDIALQEYERKNRWINSFFDKMAAKYPMHFIWPHALLCSAKTCPVSEGSAAMYFDNNHLSVYGVIKTADLYNQLFRRPEGALSGSRP